MDFAYQGKNLCVVITHSTTGILYQGRGGNLLKAGIFRIVTTNPMTAQNDTLLQIAGIFGVITT